MHASFQRLFLGLSLLALLGLATAGVAWARSGSLPPDLQAVRAAVAQYHSYGEALGAGYSAAGEPCVSSPAGTMGFHAVNGAIIGSGVNDPLRPPILLYAPRQNGSTALVGVEYWHVALVNTPDGPRPWLSQIDPRTLGMTFFTPTPSLFGQAFNGPMAGHNPQMPWHYDLHVWVVDENPAGVFAQFNPTLSC